MINERYVKKSPNISSFYSWSDAKIYDVQTSSHRYLWQGLACLWSPLKVFQQKPVLFGSLGTNMLQYIIQESLQATWNAESGLFEGGRGALEYRTGFFCFFFQLRISLERNSAAFLSSRRLGSTDSFVSMLSQSVCAQSAHSCSKEMDTALYSTLPSWGGNAFLYKLHCLQKRSVYMFLMYTAVSWCLSDLITWKPRALGSLYQSQCCCLHWLKPSLWNNFHNLV